MRILVPGLFAVLAAGSALAQNTPNNVIGISRAVQTSRSSFNHAV
jgi:hypothetical protein